MRLIQNYINGTFHESKELFESMNPTTGKSFAQVPQSNLTDVENAVTAAHNAQKEWGAMPMAARAGLLIKLADLFEAKKEEFVNLCVSDMGKSINTARNMDHPYITMFLRGHASEGFRAMEEKVTTHDELNPGSENFGLKNITYSNRSPVGVCALITPWNFPLLMVILKVAPCLVYGNTCVIKPSEFTSCTAHWFSALVHEAGFPPGVVNFIYGHGSNIGPALTSHPKVKAVTFTGSSATGMKIASNATKSLKKVSMECGGKNPAVIFESADLDHTVQILKRAIFENNGQVCLNTERLYVQDKIYDQFVEKLVNMVEQDLVPNMGDPLDKETEIGPLSSKVHLEKVTRMVQTAIDNGAKIVNPSGFNNFLKNHKNADLLKNGGYFFPPTLLTNVDHSMEIMRKEVFGPIACIVKFSSEDKAIELANDTDMGLGACVFTNDLSQAHRVSGQIDAGQVWVNDWGSTNGQHGFGGMKQSGLGREGAEYAKEFYTELRVVSIPIKKF